MGLTEEHTEKSLLAELALYVSLGEDLHGLSINILTTDRRLADWCDKEFQAYVASHQGLFVRRPEEDFVSTGPIYMVGLSNVSEDVEESPSVSLDPSLHWKVLGHICDTGWEPFQYETKANPTTTVTTRCFKKLLTDE